LLKPSEYRGREFGQIIIYVMCIVAKKSLIYSLFCSIYGRLYMGEGVD